MDDSFGLDACQVSHWIREKLGCELTHGVCYASENGIAVSEWECGEDAVNDKQTVGIVSCKTQHNIQYFRYGNIFLKRHFLTVIMQFYIEFVDISTEKKSTISKRMSLLLTIMLHWE